MEPEAGTVVATRYRILRPLGRGGMGEVWAAENIRTGRQVAIKLLRAESKSKSSAIERFRREARAAGAINSDHVTQVLDIDEDPEHGIAIVFELLEGESLIERLKRAGPMSFAELHPVIEQVWLGLAAAHAAGIIHRDLKPSNVFLEHRPDGVTRVKILDFGISKLPKELTSDTLTEVGQSLGTFSFMPPEQIGKARTVDHRADIYATTTLIYQALSGQLPYDARNILLMVELKSKQEPRKLAAAMNEPVDPALEAFLTKGMARDPAQRFQSALEALAAWRELAPTAAQSQRSQEHAAAPWQPPAATKRPPENGAREVAGVASQPGRHPSSWPTVTPPDAADADRARERAIAAQQQAARDQAARQHAAREQALGMVPMPARPQGTSPLATRPTVPGQGPVSPHVVDLPPDSEPRDSTTVPTRVGPPVIADPTSSDGVETIAIPFGMRPNWPTRQPKAAPRPEPAPPAAAAPFAAPLDDNASDRSDNGTLVMEYDARSGLAASRPNRPLPSPPAQPPAPHPDVVRQRQQLFYEEQERARQQQARAYTPEPRAVAPYGRPEPLASGIDLRPPPRRHLAPLIVGAILFALVGFGFVALVLRYFNL